MTATETAADTAPATHAGGVWGAGYRGATVGIFALVLLIAFESIAVATAMPVAARELGGVTWYGMAFGVFATTSLIALVVAGRLADTRGPRLPLMAGVIIFGAGLLVAGAASSMALLVSGRAVQGLGAGMVSVALYVVVAQAYPEVLRPRLFSIISTGWVLPSLVGPAIAGTLAEHVSWRWVFLGIPLLTVPPLLALAPMLRRLTPPDERPADAPGQVWLALGATAGAGLVQYAGTRLDLTALAAVVIAVPLLVGTVPRLLPPGTLRAWRGLPTVVLMSGLTAGTFFAAEAFVPLLLVHERGTSATVAGLTLTAAAMGWTAASWYQGGRGAGVPRHRLITIGTIAVAAGIALSVAALWLPAPAVVSALAWIVAGAGMGLASPSLSILVLRFSPPQEAGANSAASQVSGHLGRIVLIALGSAVFAGLHTAAGRDTRAFAMIFGLLAAIATASVLIAPRTADGARER